MAHELTITNGKAEMAYVGDAPWHDLGNKLQANAPIETWVDAAGMKWEIKRSTVRYNGQTAYDLPFEAKMDSNDVLYRGDNGNALGIVSDKYQIVQPAETLEFFRDLLPVGFTLDTAGTLFGGKRFWALAKIGGNAIVTGNDEIGGYLLMSSSADGSLATTAKFTTVRVVCNNTLGMALHGGKAKEIAISHRTMYDAAKIKQALGIATGAFAEFMQVTRSLAGRPISIPHAEALTLDLIRANGGTTRDDVSKSKAYNTILTLFQTGQGNHGQTAWDWVNGVTEYVDHVQRGKTPDHRLVNAWYGKGDALKSAALELAIANA